MTRACAIPAAGDRLCQGYPVPRGASLARSLRVHTMTARLRSREIQIKGHSGCLVEVVSTPDASWVDKAAPTPEYAERLRRQIRKQRDARSANRLSSVRIPEILSERDTADGGYSVRMEYLSLLNCLEFYSTASLDAIEGVARHLIAFVEANLAECSIKPVEATLLLDKLDEIKAHRGLSRNGEAYGSLFASVRKRIGELRGFALPIGPTHGDLTLSNVMVASDLSHIGLFDFLDSYLESPLVDIAKVRQDTQFGWSSLMSQGPVDRVRFGQIMRHTDAIIVDHFRNYEWFCRGIDVIQAVNLLRIAPYAKSESVHRFIISALCTLGFDE